jgi:opacity protein-like surface antigen
MKKLLLAAALAVSVSVVTAQSGTPTFGLKAGINLSDVKVDTDDEDEASERRFAYHFGGFVNLPISSMFSVNPELLFSAEGGKEEEKIGGDEYKSVIKLNYLNIPVMLQYNNPSGFFAETGPQIGFLMSAKAKEEVNGDNEDEEDIKDDLSGTNISWGIGLGYKLASGIGFGARYNYGLSNIAKEDTDDAKLKTSTIQISLIYSFGK